MNVLFAAKPYQSLSMLVQGLRLQFGDKYKKVLNINIALIIIIVNLMNTYNNISIKITVLRPTSTYKI